MRKRLLAILVGAAALWPSESSAQAGWTGDLTPQSGFVENSDNLVAYTVETTTYAGCAAGGAFILIASNDDRRAREWATYLTALTSGRKIRLYYDGTCNAWGYVNVTAIWIQ